MTRTVLLPERGSPSSSLAPAASQAAAGEGAAPAAARSPHDDATALQSALPSLAAIPVPAPGKVHRLPAGHGSSDAMLLAGLASREAPAGRTLAVVCASTVDAQRLHTHLGKLLRIQPPKAP